MIGPIVSSGGAGGVATPTGSLVLLDTQVVSGDTTQVDFSAVLDGDVDEIYIIEGQWEPPASAGALLRVRFNDALWTAVTGWIFATSVAPTKSETANCIVAQTTGTDDYTHVFSSRMVAVTGMRRMLMGDDSSSRVSDAYQMYFMASVVEETATNIVSLGLDCSVASGIKAGSIFKLYKVVAA